MNINKLEHKELLAGLDKLIVRILKTQNIFNFSQLLDYIPNEYKELNLNWYIKDKYKELIHKQNLK
tara:strand:+ start:878 stop:1075 length:198 start_codon:yes stop_codon:yes gene_type:complete